MPMKPVWLRLEQAHIADGLGNVMLELEKGTSDVDLDFTCIGRIDADGLKAMEKLAGIAERKPVKVALHGVHVDVYKVLKLTKLAPRFSFVD